MPARLVGFKQKLGRVSRELGIEALKNEFVCRYSNCPAGGEPQDPRMSKCLHLYCDACYAEVRSKRKSGVKPAQAICADAGCGGVIGIATKVTEKWMDELHELQESLIDAAKKESQVDSDAEGKSVEDKEEGSSEKGVDESETGMEDNEAQSMQLERDMSNAVEGGKSTEHEKDESTSVEPDDHVADEEDECTEDEKDKDQESLNSSEPDSTPSWP